MGTKAPTATDRLVGTRIRQRRIAIGMSQETLAEALGISITQVQKYERGADRIGAARLYEVTTILKTYLMFFFATPDGDDNEGDPGEMSQDMLTDHETMQVALAFSRIHEPEMRQAILALVLAAAGRGRVS
nr:helix-turn-helix transcriptional regulator [Methylobacterium sp. SyP6R]